MSKRLLVVSCSMACMLFSAGAFAGTDLSNSVGNWQCHAQNSNDFATMSVEHTPNDWYVSWILGFKDDGTSSKKVLKVRYDQARQKYVMFAFADDGSYGYGLTDGGSQTDSNGNNSLVFKGEYFQADGTDVKFTKTFTSDPNGVTITFAPEGGETYVSTCTK